MVKLMKHRLYRAVMSLLGFAASCTPIMKPMYGPAPAEYGTPHTDLVVRGTVTDQDGKPIPGIQVKAFRAGVRMMAQETDASGKVEMGTEHYEYGYEPNLAFEDIDGPENGSFAPDTLFSKDLEAKQIAPGDGHWYGGAYEIVFEKKLRPAGEDGE